MSKLVDLKVPDSVRKPTSITLNETTIMRDFDIQKTINIQKTKEKIESMERTVRNFKARDVMMNSIIDRTYNELESFAPNEYTKRGQKQNTLMKQLETLGLVHDTIMKYEDTIYKYHKILVDLENHRVTNFAKLESLKKEEIATKDNLAGLLADIQHLFAKPDPTKVGGSLEITPQELLMQDLEKELKDNNY